MASLEVHKFSPKTLELLQETGLQNGRFRTSYSIPVGLIGLSAPDLKAVFKNSLDTILLDPKPLTQAIAVSTNIVLERTLEIVLCYWQTTESLASFDPHGLISLANYLKLVRKALLLYLNYVLINRSAYFTESSALIIRESLEPGDQSAIGPYSSSKLLNLQIKYILFRIAQELAYEILAGLEKILRNRTKDSWPVSLCTILLLCMCIEEVRVRQISSAGIDHFIGKEPPTENLDIEACRTLESSLKAITGIFHDVYKTNRSPADGGAREGGFNPLRQALAEGGDSNFGLDEAARYMVRDFGRLITESCE
jgi:hypothetical protein